MKFLLIILKALPAIVLGLFLSFLTIAGLEVFLPDPNPFRREGLNLWLVSPIIAFWLLLMLWLALRKWSGGKIHTQGIELLPPTASELIDSVIEAMGYRKSVRADVRQELTDHFLDALHGCQNEQERQKCAEELIAEFGDVKLLGKLIRRGKKRCRPLWRTILARAFQLVGVLFVLLILYIAWFFTGKPVITTNYIDVMNAQVRPQADESQNARSLYEQAIISYVEPGKLKQEPSSDVPRDADFDTSPRPYAQLKEEEKQVLSEWLAANQKAVELLRQGNAKPYYWHTYSTNGQSTELLTVLLPHLQELKRCGQLLCWHGIVQAREGRIKEAFDSILESYRLGMHLRNKNILIEQLVAIAIEADANRTIRLVLSEHAPKLDAAILESLQTRFAGLIAGEDFIVGFDGERLFMYDEIQRCFTQSRLGKSHIYIQRINGMVGDITSRSDENPFWGQWFHILFTHPDRDATLAAANRFYAAMDEFAEYSPAQLRAEGINVTERMEQFTKGNLLLGLLTPALERVIQISHRNRADSQATLAVIAIMQYQKQKGDLPQPLDELVKAGLLQAVPIDPYSDAPLVYKVQDGGFMLYSIGSDFKDDGGRQSVTDEGKPRKWDGDGDMLFWPLPQNSA